MQTFLPYPSFSRSASVLDRLRLGKQRVETLQILNALHGDGGWSNHPAVKMWRGYANSLVEYGVAICDEWLRRGYQDSCKLQIEDFHSGVAVDPLWLGDGDFHLSHQSNLVRKDPVHYREYFPYVSDDLEYVWPCNDRGHMYNVS